MGNQQFTQYIQIDNPDVPLVQTGFESYVPFIVSDRFAIKAKKDGKVFIKNDLIHVKYNDGTEEIYSVKPFKARTKRGAYLPLEYNVLVTDGQNVKQGNILAATNSLKTGKLAVGKNLIVAEMSYRGMNYEDGWVIAEDLNEKYKSKIYEKLTILVPKNAKIIKFNLEEKKETRPGEILIEYTTTDNDLIFIDAMEEAAENNEEFDDVGVGKEVVGSKIRYRSVGGKIADISIKLNTERIDEKIERLWKKLTGEIKEQLKICEKLKTKKEQLDCKNNIEHIEILNIGGHKFNNDIYDGAIIEVFIEKNNEIRTGSKFTLAATGGKGTVQYVIPKDKKPIAVDSKLEIDFVPTPLSLISRKNPSILMLMYLGKIVYFLNKEVIKLINENKINEARDLLIKVYGVLDKTKDEVIINAIKGFFSNKLEFIKKYVNKHKDILNDPPFPFVVPPFKNQVKIKDIEKAAMILGIKLNEKVYIPEEDTYTEYEVPVGIMPVYLLEHFPKEMSGARGSIAVKRQLMTGQGRSGTKEGNGAIRLGLYDIFSVISRQPTEMMKELWLLKADTNNAKKQLIYKTIRNNGKVPLLKDINITKDDMFTKKMIEAYFIGAILEPQF
jgi:DNA-directed RNA polymerase subunit beta